MCDRCNWRDLVKVVGDTIEEKPQGLVMRKQEWIEQIRVTVDDNRHATDHQKKVVRQILREAGSGLVKKVPKATDRTRWSEAKKKRVQEARKKNREYDRYGQF